mmetsp:Transcript_14666/g.25563  ORF Transcript_14666/g.25563 Transcript_14666/m.25563 type:complete len:385 (+) Transcript_14666:33-1187(+)
MFHDLNTRPPAGGARGLLCKLLDCGYSVTAQGMSTRTEGRVEASDSCTLQPVPLSTLMSAGTRYSAAASLLQASCFSPIGLQQLSRLTFLASDPVQAEALASASSVTGSYDLLAIQPGSERVLQQACLSLDVDIITMDATQRLPFKLKPATLRPALQRGLMFEVCYSGALGDTTARVMFISNLQALARCTRGRNIVVSSGAASAEGLRTPHAVASLLACALGVPSHEATRMLASNAAAAVAHGVARRSLAALGPGAAAVVSVIASRPVGTTKQQGRSGGHRRGGAMAVVSLAVSDLPDSMPGAAVQRDAAQPQRKCAQSAAPGPQRSGQGPYVDAALSTGAQQQHGVPVGTGFGPEQAAGAKPQGHWRGGGRGTRGKKRSRAGS